MFEDRRVTGERRQHHNPAAIPVGGCRRVRERRDLFRQYHAAPWWLRTNYAEELQAVVGDRSPSADATHTPQSTKPVETGSAASRRRH